jgi:hypothetical protein
MRKLFLYIWLILLVCISLQSFSFALQNNNDSTYVRFNKHGPFILINKSGVSVNIYVLVDQIHYSVKLKYTHQEDDFGYTFIDSCRHILYQIKNKPENGDGSNTIHIAQIIVPRVGPLILLMTDYGPSTCSDGTLGQLFGFDKFDKIVPFSPYMSTICNSTFRPVLIQANGKFTQSEYSNDSSAVPAIETDLWTGNFAVHTLTPIWSSSTSPKRFYQKKYQVSIDSSDVARNRERNKGEDIKIDIYSKPHKSKTLCISVPVRENSTIKFLDAVDEDDQKHWWLHIVIDGVKGYITNPDFPKVGLPDAG